MTVGVTNTSETTEPPAATPTTPTTPTTRRDVIRRLLLPAALAATAAPVAVAVHRSASGTHVLHAVGGPEDTAFAETYRGRRIRGTADAAGRTAGAAGWQVTVDGRPLHLMRRADGTWLTMVDHYRSYPTPLAAARAAVDELGPGRSLRETGPHTGGGHGVHA
ncbi:tyrosinase cofactor [Streptomyces sp. NPDC023723]|uniref:tyrosinase cofactor n=1 Tax=Streptomyces sp. NPDC023723 TaxID=3154323 RepID=UPI0033CEDB37